MPKPKSRSKRSAPRQKQVRRPKYKADSDLELKDIPEVRDWDGAIRGRFYRPVKKAISLRLDADVLAWFKAHSDRYQSKINEVLREYVRRNQ